MRPVPLVLHPALTAWLDTQLPGLGGVARVPVFCCERFPFERVLRYLRRFSGLMLFNRIYIRNEIGLLPQTDPALLELLFHELIHVRQFHGRLVRASLAYAWGLLRVGYRNHPMEIEARAEAARLLQRYQESENSIAGSPRAA